MKRVKPRNQPWNSPQGVFTNGSRRREEADFGENNTPRYLVGYDACIDSSTHPMFDEADVIPIESVAAYPLMWRGESGYLARQGTDPNRGGRAWNPSAR